MKLSELKPCAGLAATKQSNSGPCKTLNTVPTVKGAVNPFVARSRGEPTSERTEDGQCFCAVCKERAAAWEAEKRETARRSGELVPCAACHQDAACPVCGGTGEVWQP